MAKVQVIAIAQGYYDLNLREVGDVFMVDDAVFKPRPKLDADGKPTGKFYDLPSWFKKAVAKPAPAPVLVPEDDTAKEQVGQAQIEAHAAFLAGKQEAGSDLA